MKYVFIILALFCFTICSKAQKDSINTNTPMYSVRPGFAVERINKENVEIEAFRKNHLYMAGDAMQKSTTFMYGSLASSVLSGTCFAIGGTANNSGARTGLFVAGGIFGAVSLGCLIFNIHYHDKAGRELRLSAGEVVFKF